MEFQKKIHEPDIPRKRPSDVANDHELKEFRKPKTMVSEYLPTRIKTGVQIVCDPRESQRNNPFGSRPTGKVKFWDPTCDDQKPKVATIVVSRGKALKSSDNIDSNLGKMTSRGEDLLVDSKHKLKSIKPEEFRRNNPSFVSRPVGKVKFWDPNASAAQRSNEVTIAVSRREQVRRENIKEAMAMFDEVYERLFRENRYKPKEEKIAHWRVPMEVAKLVKQKLKWRDPEKISGPICGVQVGDKFRFRSQLLMIGLHCQPQSGIDYAKIGGKNLAISIVNSHRYSNESGSCDTLIYYGQGGIGFFGSKLPPEDQKLERGNLALKNSMDEKNQVRVIRKVDEVFVYDGLYIVKHYTKKRSEEGKMIFKFQLNRVPGQPPVYKMV